MTCSGSQCLSHPIPLSLSARAVLIYWLLKENFCIIMGRLTFIETSSMCVHSKQGGPLQDRRVSYTSAL